MTVNEYFEALKGKRVCVIGLGISNRPLVKMLLERGIPVECRDRTPREKLLPEVLELERQGAKLTLGDDYLEHIEADVVFRTPGLNAFCPQLMALRKRAAWSPRRWRHSLQFAPAPSSASPALMARRRPPR